MLLPSDNEPIEVKRLGLYELEEIAPPLPDRLYYYEMQMAVGQPKLMPYDLDQVKVPPKPPSTEDDLAEGSPAWHQLLLWQTHQAAVAHYQEWLSAMEARQRDITLYILRSCVRAEDQGRVITAEDMRAIVVAAMVEQLTMEVVERVCETTFQDDLGRATYPASLIFTDQGWLWVLLDFKGMGSPDDATSEIDRGGVGQSEFVRASA